MEVILSKNLDSLRVAKGGDKVYKDECIYSYDTPKSDGGLYVSLTSFLGVSKSRLQLHWSKTGEPLYLHIKQTEKPPPPPSETAEEEVKKPTRLAIGVEGGFDGGLQKKEYEQTLSLVAMPEMTSVPWPCGEAPPQIQASVKSVLDATTASRQENIAAWDGEKRAESKLAADLVQLDNGVKVPPSGWKCAHCDLTSNLWMNLTDGTIVCGRKYFDGSGGNNHAVEHYERTKYPLAVKLGTITPDGADVYSYPEDNMVVDPLLNQHLKHFGINVADMTKTDATMTELEIDMNMRIGEWSIIQESGKQLQPCYGPGNTGMVNLGNSCYLNSIMQVVFTLPEFQHRYGERAELVFKEGPANPTGDFETQMCKLAQGLLSGNYSQPSVAKTTDKDSSGSDTSGASPVEPEGISPGMFKALIGKGHPEFSTMRQQDAQEFFLYLLGTIDKQQRLSSGVENPADCFRFQFQDRIQCATSKKVTYSCRDDFILQLPVPMEAATNKEEVRQWEEKKKLLEASKQRINTDDIVRARVPFTSCLECFSQAQNVSDFYSTAIGGKTAALKTTRLSTFPDYLMIQMAKFSFADDWVPKKYDVLIDVPDQLDLSHLKGCGLQPGEEELPAAPPEGASSEAEEELVLDEGVVMQLVSMGFDMEGCRRAVYHTHNQGVEPAMNWVLEHMGDADFSSPFVPPSKKKKLNSGSAAQNEPPEEAVAMVTSMGFSVEQAVKALKATNNSVERAIDWVFSHAGELDSSGGGGVAMETEEAAEPHQQYRDGPGKYELVGFVSHMGTSTMCGHYVCHIKKDGRWVIFNDSKVAISETPPRELGYLYLFRRMTA